MYLGSIIFPFPISSFLFTPQREKGKGESGRRRKKKFWHSKKGTKREKQRQDLQLPKRGKTDGGPFLFCLPRLRGACFSFPHTANRIRKHSKIQLRKSIYGQGSNVFCLQDSLLVVKINLSLYRSKPSLCSKARQWFPLISNHHHMKTKTNTAAGKSISLLSPFTITSNA